MITQANTSKPVLSLIDILLRRARVSPSCRATVSVHYLWKESIRSVPHAGASYRLQHRWLQPYCDLSWCIKPDTLTICMKDFPCLRRQHAGNAHLVASCDASCSCSNAVYRRIIEKLKAWMKVKHMLLTQILCFEWNIILNKKSVEVWVKCKKVQSRYFDRNMLLYIKNYMYTSIYHHFLSLRVLAVIIFLWLLMSGDIELNPGPKEGMCDTWHVTCTCTVTIIVYSCICSNHWKLSDMHIRSRTC